MNKKMIRYSFITVILVLIGLVYFGFSEYNRKHKDVSDAVASFNTTGESIIREFTADEQSANTKYLDKIIEVSGIVKSIDKDDAGSVTVVLGNPSDISSIRCNIDSAHSDETTGLQKNIPVTIKGVCTGFNADELLGSDLILNRCSINKNKNESK